MDPLAADSDDVPEEVGDVVNKVVDAADKVVADEVVDPGERPVNPDVDPRSASVARSERLAQPKTSIRRNNRAYMEAQPGSFQP